MPIKADQQKAELIETLAAQIRERLPKEKVETVERFARLYFRNVPPDDLAHTEREALYGAALGLFQFGAIRTPGQPKIRVFNPDHDEHGWDAGHTIVEIVNDDMPFLVDSVTAALNGHGLTVHLVVHPIVLAARDAKGALVELQVQGEPSETLRPESFMHVEVDEQSSETTLDAIRATLEKVLQEVRRAVTDWRTMRGKVDDVIGALKANPPPLPTEETTEVVDFLHWMNADHFTFLGYREYGFSQEKGRTDYRIADGSGLGILKENEVSVFQGMRQYATLPPEVQAFMKQPKLLMVTKANRLATVHRASPMDVVIVKSFGPKGEVTGERMFVGLFTSVAYNRSARDIPFLRQKVTRTLARAGFDPHSHDGKALTHILDTFPRDELFQISGDELLDIGLGILHLQERQRTALFLRKDPYERFVSCLIYAPRDRYNTDLRRKYQHILEKAFNGTVTAFQPQFGEGAHARVHLIVRTKPGKIPDVTREEVEARLVEAGRTWSDKLQEALVSAKGEEAGLTYLRRYREAFPTAYREQTNPQASLHDLERIEQVIDTGIIGLNLYRPIESAENRVRFKLYHAARPVPLSDVLPMLENMGLKVIAENPYEVQPEDRDEPVWIHDFTAESRDGAAIDVGRIKPIFQEAFARLWYGAMEDDGFNRLVLAAGLGWREVTVLRAYGKYLRQARVSFSQDSLEDTLARHPDITRRIVEMFEARFDPARETDRELVERSQMAEIERELENVPNLDEDRIIRRYANLVRVTLRTNFYQKGADGEPKPYLSFKLDSSQVDELPLPRPWREIFVYSPRMEGIHLRGGKVARGGIRWSDRREDFRTEVLGLMKAQMVKNAVIVPVGSKGGFVVKRPPREGGREAFQAEGIECYKMLMRGLLDVTDNLSDAGVAHPPTVVRHDEDDPYLVVAADKGTASFSDIANGISQEYGFWLDDAFASGGSAGYDHKKMGITARGAWEGVKRHFRELGVDIQNEDFTVIGVGDMSGDVFGNGMLCSRHTRLQAAFNHLHIFVDPDPDAAISFKERQRLYDLGRGSWDQYDQKLISKGGGVFDRKAKAVKLTREMQALTGLDRESVTPNELISAMLRAPVDLLWFGGIGTYVKARDESHAEVGDKANDSLRVDAARICARVIGEGANLAVTQRGRIEYALKGGRADGASGGGKLNTDFIDNSAGVDCSDHEVNIKILLNAVVAAGDMTLKQRNALLERMTEEVGGLCLRDNYLQTQALTMTMAEATELLDQQARFMKGLEKAGHLDRAIEMLPNDEELTERLGRREGLTRPELSVLLSYSKITLYDALLASDLPDDPALEDDLRLYFPEPLRKKYAAPIKRHTLSREIVATFVTNSLINRTGPTFVAEMIDKTGMGPADIARAYLIVRDSFELRSLWQRIEELDAKVPAEVQTQMMLYIRRLVERTTSWILRQGGERLEVDRQIAHLRPAIEALTKEIDGVLYPDARTVIDRRAAAMIEQGAPEDLARHISSLNVLAAGVDLVQITDAADVGLTDAASVYFDVGRRLGIAWLRDSALKVQASNHWQKQAIAAILDDLYALQADLSHRVIDRADGEISRSDAPALIEAWIDRRRQPIERIDQLIAELRAMDTVDLSMLAVANRRLRGLMAS
ncbi:NAD-glutamate dehydrogenase [Inquilinus sp. CAU 1745]|uniref:NAD-glutamate dehydrogenase n=1 Tax=Inquilinus sp. CAU 1745 TaxID=3140369 RepID=UPI00325B482E